MGVGGEEAAKDLLFRLNVAAALAARRGKERRTIEEPRNLGEAGKASFDAPTIKVEGIGRNHQRMLSYGFSYSDSI